MKDKTTIQISKKLHEKFMIAKAIRQGELKRKSLTVEEFLAEMLDGKA